MDEKEVEMKTWVPGHGSVDWHFRDQSEKTTKLRQGRPSKGACLARISTVAAVLFGKLNTVVQLSFVTHRGA